MHIHPWIYAFYLQLVSHLQCIYTHGGASAKFSTNSHDTDYSAKHYIWMLIVIQMAKSICMNTVVSLTLLVKIQIVFIICNPLVFLNDLSLNIKTRNVLLSSLKEKRRGTQDRSSLFFFFNPFLPVTLEHLSTYHRSLKSESSNTLYRSFLTCC